MASSQNTSSTSTPAESMASSPILPSTPTFHGHDKNLKFIIKTGGKSWECTLQDRASYERQKSHRNDSVDSSADSSVDSSASSTTS